MPQTEDRYYMILFAAEGRPNVPRLAHTFCTFAKAKVKKGGDPANVECHTISWLPATLEIRLLFQPPEKGVNLDLKETLKHEATLNATISAWGPYEIKKDLFDLALTQIKRLQSGKIAFKALDGKLRPDAATNCFHAISDVVDGPLLDTGMAYGQPATRMVLEHLAPWIIEPKTVHRELVDRLGLRSYKIKYRDDSPPNTRSVGK